MFRDRFIQWIWTFIFRMVSLCKLYIINNYYDIILEEKSMRLELKSPNFIFFLLFILLPYYLKRKKAYLMFMWSYGYIRNLVLIDKTNKQQKLKLLLSWAKEYPTSPREQIKISHKNNMHILKPINEKERKTHVVLIEKTNKHHKTQTQTFVTMS